MNPQLVNILVIGVAALQPTSGPGGAKQVLQTDAAFVAVRPGRITGVVTDKTGAPVPGATVTAVPARGGTATRVFSRPDGTYEVGEIAEGAYFVDFELTGFDLVRRNNVRAIANASSHADAVLQVSRICECVNLMPTPSVRQRAGQVLSTSGHPLPHASLHIDGVSPDFGMTDGEGRFVISVSLDKATPLTVSESGFQSQTQQVSGSIADPVIFRLATDEGASLPDVERRERSCCGGDSFMRGRHRPDVTALWTDLGGSSNRSCGVGRVTEPGAAALGGQS